jgi:hypothetical protein
MGWLMEVAQVTNKISEALALLGKGSKNVREMRTLILGLEEIMFSMPNHLEGDDFNAITKHHFEQGVYMRELFIPKGMVLTGKIHKTKHLNILSAGKITVWTEEGMKTLTAPAVIRSEPGIKRVGYAHEDSVWITVHQNPSDERDIKKVEDRLFSMTFDEAYSGTERTFEDAIRFLGFTPEEVKRYSENENDKIPFPLECSVEIKPSEIHGVGMFATKDFLDGEYIGPARINGMRTPAGAYSNHSSKPNSKFVMKRNGDVEVFATSVIRKGEEILSDYYFNFVNTRIHKERNLLCQQQL